MYYKLIHFMCVLDGPCIETTEKLNIDQKNPKLQTNLICIFEKKEQTIEGIPVYHECTQKLKEKRSSENVVSCDRKINHLVPLGASDSCTFI